MELRKIGEKEKAMELEDKIIEKGHRDTQGQTQGSIQRWDGITE